jgi:hydroxymethylpyrimidine pyrophosphatase-like HAD family hydrolase
VTLLQNAYHSYAMENAHPEVKKYARFSAQSNNDNGVIQIIKQIL